MTNSGLSYTRGTLQAKDVDVVGSLLNNILQVTGPTTLDGTHLYIMLTGTGPYTITLPQISQVGAIILTFWVRDQSTPTITVQTQRTDLIGVTPGSPAIDNFVLDQYYATAIIMSDPTVNRWYVLSYIG